MNDQIYQISNSWRISADIEVEISLENQNLVHVVARYTEGEVVDLFLSTDQARERDVGES